MREHRALQTQAESASRANAVVSDMLRFCHIYLRRYLSLLASSNRSNHISAGRGSEDDWRSVDRRKQISNGHGIVSLAPHCTEILFALGLGHRVVGVTDLCDFPSEAARRHHVSRSVLDTTAMTSADVEEQIQQLKLQVTSWLPWL